MITKLFDKIQELYIECTVVQTTRLQLKTYVWHDGTQANSLLESLVSGEEGEAM